jgi:hypothetical protein
MKTIELNHGFAVVDDEDYPAISKYNWHRVKIGNKHYAMTNINCKNKFGSYRTTCLMHKMIMPDGTHIRHRDGNGLNNTRENLTEKEYAIF